MGTKRSYTIIVEGEVWDEETVAALVGMGHTVKRIQAHSYDFIIGPRAWRLPTGKGKLKDIALILKQGAKLIKAGDTVAPTQLTIPQEVADGLEDTQIPLEETDGEVTKRIVTSYSPATRPGKKKKRTRRVTRGGYAFSDQGCDDGAGC